VSGLIAVQIHNGGTIDVRQVDPTTLRFGPGGATPVRVFGSHGDPSRRHHLEREVLFRAADAKLRHSAGRACLRGNVHGGRHLFEGCVEWTP